VRRQLIFPTAKISSSIDLARSHDRLRRSTTRMTVAKDVTTRFDAKSSMLTALVIGPGADIWSFLWKDR